MDCEATGSAERGPYENTGTVTGEVPVVGTLTATDPSHHFGYVTGVNIEKSTNGEDADAAPGPAVAVGDTVTWTYVVTPDDVPVHHVEVTDDQGVTPVFVGGDTDGDDILDVEEEWIYEATGTAAEGQYENIATVTGLGTLEEILADSDPSHHNGDVPAEPGPASDLPETGSGVDALMLIGFAQVLVGGMAILWAWVRDRVRRSAMPSGGAARTVRR